MSALLEARNLTRSFGGVRAVNGYSLVLNERELVGLIGPNGAGKTTVFNLLSGIFPPTSGTISIDGRPIANKRPDLFAQAGIGRTFQNIRLFRTMSVLENVLLGMECKASLPLLFKGTPFFTGGRQRLERARELLALVGLGGRENDNADSLPYGQQRKLEIARALAGSPRVLMLDEPAAGMNPQETEDLTGLIRTIHRDFPLSIILIEHDMGLVMSLSQRIQVLRDGALLAEGTPEEVRDNPDVIAAYLGEKSAVSWHERRALALQQARESRKHESLENEGKSPSHA